MSMLLARDLWSTSPPPPRSRLDNWPTVLFSWWATAFSVTIILIRLCGRKVRSDRLFREDHIMTLAIIPLVIRMILIHFVLIYGTNNVETVGITYTATELANRSLGAKLVLPARIFYAMYIWLCKATVSEFLKRITGRIWRTSYERTLQCIRIFLVATFIAVVISTLAECQPFQNYWQVIPDPGPACRLGYGFLLTMSVCDIVSDILLVAFPIPVVLNSGQTWKRKLQMGSLFSLSIIMVVVTATRVPMVIEKHGLQQYRTVWASCEILASTFVSNGVILGSFIRGKGTKRNRYRSQSMSDSIERAPATRRSTLRTLHAGDSDEALFRDAGWRMPEHLQDDVERVARPAPPAPPAMPSGGGLRNTHKSHSAKQPPPIFRDLAALEANKLDRSSESDDSRGDGPDFLNPRFSSSSSPPSTAMTTTHSAKFFDVGNLLDNPYDPDQISPHRMVTSHPFFSSPSSSPLSSDGVRGGRAGGDEDESGGIRLQDLGPSSRERGHAESTFYSPTSSLSPASANRRPNSRTFVQDMGGITALGPPIGVLGPRLVRHDTQTSLQDAGGLLSQFAPTATVAGGPGQGARPASGVPMEREESGHRHFESDDDEED